MDTMKRGKTPPRLCKKRAYNSSAFLMITRVAALFLILTMALNFSSYAISESDFTFDASTGTIIGHTFPNNGSKRVIIPSTINGLSVKAIGAKAFKDTNSIAGVTIPNGITSIGAGAFSGCTKLDHVIIPNSVTNISEYAFENCSSLCSIIIPDSLTNITEKTFYGCSALNSIKITKSVKSIGDYAFYGCDCINVVNYYGRVSEWNAISIGVGNDPLTSASLINIHDEESGWVFNLKSLTSGTIIHGDYSLSEITIPSNMDGVSVTKISYTFDSNHTDTGAEITPALKKITIPESVTSIGDRTFYGCKNLTSVTMTDSLTSIGENAFYGCSILNDVYYSGTKSEWNAISISDGNDSLTSATIHCSDGIISATTTTPTVTPTPTPTVTPTPTPTETQSDEPTPMPEPTKVKLGDVNGDGKITRIDSTRLSRYIAHWDGYDDTNVDMDAADINGDGKITRVDSTRLSRYIAHWDGYEQYFEE